MKKLIITSIFLVSTLLTFAQDAEFKVEVNPSEVLMENYFEVKFILKNGSGSNFTPPNFKEFSVIAGPNQASSFSMVNGTVDQSLTYSFHLKPIEPGNYFIEPASINVNGNTLESLPVEVVVLANPDGIQHKIPQEEHGFNHNFNMDSFFDFNFGEGLEKELTPKKKKPKRKVYKL